MRRRTLRCIITAGLLVAVTTPVVVLGQGTPKPPRIGIAVATSPASGRPNVDAFRRGLRELGYVEGQNIVIDERWTDGKPDRFPALIDELLRSQVSLLVVSSVVGAMAAKKATNTTPVVFVAVTDPAGTGVVTSLSRPGGNLTGTSLLIGEEFAGKWVELVKETAPKAASVAALAHAEHPLARKYAKAMDTAARTLGLTLRVVEVRDVAGLDAALGTMAKSPPGALIVPASPFFGVHRKRIAEFALPRRIPTIGHDRSLVADGVLVSYGPSIADSYRRGAVYVDKILKGAKPADLPVEQPTTFEIAVNLKTARAIGVTIPPSLLARANHIVE